MRTNFIEENYALIQCSIDDRYNVMQQCNVDLKDVVNLCGGIPSLDISSFYIKISSQYHSAITVEIETNLYEVVRAIDFEIKRIDNNFMFVYDKGNHIGTNLFLNQLQTARSFGFKKIHINAMAPQHHDETIWDGYYFWANLGFGNSDIEEYKEWAAEMGRKEKTLSDLMQTEEGRALWKKAGFTWIGNFFIETGHRCWKYLENHLRRKGIQIDLN
jgi:hypothetical protein